jgi:dienelactone hydrolase
VLRRLALAATLTIVAVTTACSDDGGGTDEADVPDVVVRPTDYSGRGPYAVGQLDLELDAGHRIAVFYPVDRAAVGDDAEPYSYSGEDILDPTIAAVLPGALSGEVAPADTWVELPASEDGPFPTVLHSHGFSGNLRFGNQHNAAVASWGYVVAAVDHPERGLAAILDTFVSGGEGEPVDPDLDADQLLAALDLLQETGEDAASPLAGVVDTERVAAEGHSAGGSASGTAAYDLRVDLWIGQAPAAPRDPAADAAEGDDPGAVLAASTPPEVPSLIIAAEGDTVIELDQVEEIYGWLRAPKRLAVIAASGHAVFVDPCVPIRESGGLSAFVEALGLDPADVPLVELGENGCLPPDVDPALVWELIDHLTVAQLNEVFEIDRDVATASLDPDYLDERFPGLLGELVSE